MFKTPQDALQFLDQVTSLDSVTLNKSTFVRIQQALKFLAEVFTEIQQPQPANVTTLTQHLDATL